MNNNQLCEYLSDIILRISYAKASQGHTANTILEYFQNSSDEQITNDYCNELILENRVSDRFIIEQSDIVMESIASMIGSVLGRRMVGRLFRSRIGQTTVGSVLKKVGLGALLAAGTTAALRPDLTNKLTRKVVGKAEDAKDNAADALRDTRQRIDQLIPDLSPPSIPDLSGKDGKGQDGTQNTPSGDGSTISGSGMNPLAKPEPETISQRQIEREYRYNKMKKAEIARNPMEAYDIVLDYLISGGHAETIEEAHYIMMEMNSKTIQNIIEGPESTSQDFKTGVTKPPAAPVLPPPAGNKQKPKPTDQIPSRGGLRTSQWGS